MFSSTNILLYAEHPLYKFSGGVFKSFAQIAAEAQATADSKSKTFPSGTNPTNYKIGDLWQDGEKVKVATAARSTYNAGDWLLAGDVTSKNTAADTTKVNGIDAAIVQGGAADGASALDSVQDMADDSKLTPQEKPALRTEWDIIEAEYAILYAKGNNYSLSEAGTYAQKFQALANFLNSTDGTWVSATHGAPRLVEVERYAITDAIDGGTMRTVFSEYYSTKATLLNAIAAKEADVAETNAKNYADEGTIYLRGTGYNRSANQILKLNGTTIYSSSALGTGLRVTVINRSDLSVVSNTTYNIYSNDANATTMANALNALTDSVIVAITSYDAMTMNAALQTAMARCGGSGTYFGGSYHRIPYALLGIPGIGKGNGIEVFTGLGATDPYAEISTIISDGVPQGVNLRTSTNSTVTYTSQPTHPYKIGDIWKDGAKVKICTANSTGAFSAGNWVLSGDVTADGTANNTLNVGTSSAATIVAGANDGTSAKASVTDMANDNKLTPSEKPTLRKEWNRIYEEYLVLKPKAETLNISTELTNYIDKFQNVANILNVGVTWVYETHYAPTLVEEERFSITDTIDGAAMRTAFSDYESKKQILQNKIAEMEATEGMQNSASLAAAITQGKILHKDTTFAAGVNDTALYRTGTWTRVASGTDGVITPSSSGQMMKLVVTGAPGTGGGFSFRDASRANAKFLTHFVAKAPVGTTIVFMTNGIGSGSTTGWVSDNKGTGDWADYVYSVKCGASGTFADTNYFYFENATYPFNVYVSKATVYDTTEREPLASQLNNDPNVTRIIGSKIWLDGEVYIEDAFVTDLVANSIVATKIQATTIDASKITTGTLSADRIAAASLSGDKIIANTIDATRLKIGSGAQGGYINNPRFSAWASTYPDGTQLWSAGGISKVTVDNVLMAQFAPTAGAQQGMQLNSSYFANGIDLDGMQYFALECRFRLTSGTNPAGASFLVDIYRQDNSYERMQLDMKEIGAIVTTNTWYVARKVFKLADANVAKTFKSVSGYLLANWTGAGDAAKTIQFASVNMFQASAQEHLAQSWTHAGTTSINGGFIATGTINASNITVGTLPNNQLSNIPSSKFDSTTQTTLTNAGTAYTRTEGWKHPTDVTTIDGGKIYTGTISAEKIYLGTGTVAAGNLNAGKTLTGTTSGTVATDGAKAVDSAYHEFGSGTGSATSGAESAYVQVDLGSTYRIAQSKTYWYSADTRVYFYKIKYSTDGTNWYYAVGNNTSSGWMVSAKNASAGNPSVHPTVDVFSLPISARYVRIYGNGNTSNLNNHMYEWELFSAAETVIHGDMIQTGTISASKISIGTLPNNVLSGITSDRFATTVQTTLTNAGTAYSRTEDWKSAVDSTYIDGGNIYTGTITAEKVLLGDPTNLVSINELTGSVHTNNFGSVSVNGNYIQKTLSSSAYLMFNDYLPVMFNPGEELYYEFYAQADAAVTASLNLWYYNSAKANTGVTGTQNISLTTTEKKFSGTINTGSFSLDTTSYYLIGLANTTNRVVKIRRIVVRRKGTGELIVDGAISSEKMYAGKIGSRNDKSWIDFNNGAFSLADGKLTWTDNELTVNGTVSANNIKGGTLAAKNGTSNINMDTGSFNFGNADKYIKFDAGTGNLDMVVNNLKIGSSNAVSASQLEDFKTTTVDPVTDFVNEDLKSKWAALIGALTVTETDISIQVPGSTNRIQITGDTINFINQNVVVAKITDQKLSINNGLFLENVILGSHSIKKYGGGDNAVTVFEFMNADNLTI